MADFAAAAALLGGASSSSSGSSWLGAGLGVVKSLEEGGLEINPNPDGWGPVSGAPLLVFDEVPYAHFDKKERCGRPADFGFNTFGNYQRNNYRDYRKKDVEGNAEFTYRHDAVEDSTFQLVDTSKTQSKGGRGGFGQKKWGQRGGRIQDTSMDRRFQGSSSRAGAGGRGTFGPQISFGAGGRGGRGRFGQAGGRGGRGGRGFRRHDRKLDRMSSVAVAADWLQIEEFDLQQMLKLQANPPSTEDLLWCGHLDQYDETFDKVTVRTAKQLRRIDNRVFYAVTTADDPVLERFAVEEVGNVFATDAILSHLMSAPRSLHSWDIVIQKTDGVIYLDKVGCATMHAHNNLSSILPIPPPRPPPPVVSSERTPSSTT